MGKITLKGMAIVLAAGVSFFIYHTAVSRSVQGNIPKDGTVLIDAFSTTGAEFRKMDIQGWAKLNNRFIAQDEMLRTINMITARLGVDPQKTKTRVQKSEQSITVTRSGQLDRLTYLTVIVQTMQEGERQKSGQSYLIVGFSHFGTPQNHNLLRNKMVGVFSPVRDDAHYSTIISGKIPKKIDVSAMQKLTKKVMDNAGAEIVESYADARMISITGYTPGISDLLTQDGKRVNINMALRYNSEDNNTYIHIGSPIITTEY